MNIGTMLRSLGPIDVRNVRRDSMTSWMIFIPIMLALFVRWGVPPFTAWLLEQHNFNFVE